MPNLSIIIPLYNEEESILELHSRIANVLCHRLQQFDPEIIFINDGSTDNSQEKLNLILQNDPRVRVTNLPMNKGKSYALMQGFALAEGELLVTLDGDLQDRPENIPDLVSVIEQGYDLVIGWKKNRKDPKHKIILSKIFNFVISRIWKIPLHDMNSGLKVMKRSLVDKLNLSSNQHRFIAVFAKQLDYKITEISVTHDPRKYGKSKFGVLRIFAGVWSLIWILCTKRKKLISSQNIKR